MRQISLFIAVSAASLCMIACNKDNISTTDENANPTIQENGTSELTIGITSMNATKSTSISDEDEVAVKNLQVLVFKDNALDAYGSVENAKELTLNATNGNRIVYALVNAPDLSDISTRTALLARTSLLENNSVSAFEMIGSCEVALPQTSTITVNVARIVSRVVIKKITRAFTAPALSELDFSIDEIFIENVAGDINYGLDAHPSVWFNKQRYCNEVSDFTYDTANRTPVTNGGTYMTEHRFFAYPNGSEDSSQSVWAPRHTRLVVKTTLGTEQYYYPITLPVLEPNKSYEINNLTITRPGSSDPDQPVSFNDVTFDINVIPWNVVTITDGITI